MKLPVEEITIETGGIQEEHSFGIADTGMVFEILRKKMYTNPISAICREVMSNARDANREAGRGQAPIKVVLPNKLNPELHVIDCGPGITPERMVNVFIKFAGSTKRNSNEQTGGFGLGAKSPFSYTDSFSIISIVDGTKRVYSAYLDETKIGKLALMHEVSTDEANGATIVVPVRDKDFNEFAKECEYASRYWDVQPTIVGEYVSLRPTDDKKFMSGPDWSLYSVGDHYYDSREGLVLIDGIQYPMEPNFESHIRGADVRGEIGIMFRGNKRFVLSFSNGIIPLAANRESIYWDDAARAVIIEKLKEIAASAMIKINQQLAGCQTYVEACKLVETLNRAFDMTTTWGANAKWNGVAVKSLFRKTTASGDVDWINFKRGAESLTVPATPGVASVCDFKRVERQRNNSFTITEDLFIVVNDVGIINLSQKRAAQIFDMHPAQKNILVIPLKEWNDSSIEPYQQYIEHILLSSVIGVRTPKDDKVAKVRRARRLVYKYAPGGDGKFNLTSLDEFEKDSNRKIYVTLDRSYDNKLIHERGQYDSVIRNLSYNSINVYGFEKSMYDSEPDGFAECVGNVKSLLTYVKEDVLGAIPKDELLSYSEDRVNDITADKIDKLRTLLPFIKHDDGLKSLHAKVVATQKHKHLFIEYRSVIRDLFEEELKKPSAVWTTINADFVALKATYPLLEAYLERFPGTHKDIEPFAHYINLIDGTKI